MTPQRLWLRDAGNPRALFAQGSRGFRGSFKGLGFRGFRVIPLRVPIRISMRALYGV